MSFNRNFHFDASIPSRRINQSAYPSKIWPGFGPQIDHLVGEAGDVATDASVSDCTGSAPTEETTLTMPF